MILKPTVFIFRKVSILYFNIEHGAIRQTNKIKIINTNNHFQVFEWYALRPWARDREIKYHIFYKIVTYYTILYYFASFHSVETKDYQHPPMNDHYHRQVLQDTQ